MWNLFGGGKGLTPPPPPTFATDTIVPLPAWDNSEILRDFILRQLFVFDDVLDPERLRDALGKLIRRNGWCKLGARLRLNGRKLEYHIPAKFDKQRAAFQYSHVRHEVDLAEHKVASLIPKPSSKPAIVADTRMFLPFMSGPDFPTKLDEYLNSDLPVLGVHIISFNDATLVTVSWPHSVADMLGLSTFLDAWSLTLQGRDDEVPEVFPFDLDPLSKLGSNPTQPYKYITRMLSVWQMVIFGLRYVFDLVWFREEEFRMICLPAQTLQTLRARAEQDLAASQSKEKPPFLSDGDLICAWWTPFAISNIPRTSNQTITVMNTFSLRTILQQDLLSTSGVVIGNVLLNITAFFPAYELFTAPIGTIAVGIRKSISDHQDRQQIEAAAANFKETASKKGYAPIYGDATMHLLTFSNWSKSRLFEVDFSAAVVEAGSGNRSGRPNKVGRPSYVQPWGFTQKLSTRNSFSIQGKDGGGNYWFSGGLRKGDWVAVERAMAEAGY